MTTDDVFYWVAILVMSIVICMVIDEIKVWLCWNQK